jgi:hypothetical protein
MSKLITSTFIATVLLACGLQTANAQPRDHGTQRGISRSVDRSDTDRENVCKQLQFNCS